MKLRALLLAFLVSVPPMALSLAQSSQEPIQREESLPRLGEIMLAKQWRHIKLWFAGKQHNWNLAAYELVQIKASLAQAATLYAGIPVSNVLILDPPFQSIDKAIQLRDGAGFVKAFNELTGACNACHRKMGREFIEIRMPVESPFSDQVFAPRTRQ